MIRLGHIDYSNCIPVHARLLAETPLAEIQVVRGLPTELNRALAAGHIDVAPCSSIEYARHWGQYRLLPLTIASRGPVQSILLECQRPPAELHGARIGMPTASATSTVLLRILLERQWGVTAEYVSFEQDRADPFAAGCAAALWIGDVALRRVPGPGRQLLDLGQEWFAWTGLPFAFALWQVRRELSPAALARLRLLLADSRAWFLDRAPQLAASYAPVFGLAESRLLSYWGSLVFDLDDDVRLGLLHFLSLAAALGEAPLVQELHLASDCAP